MTFQAIVRNTFKATGQGEFSKDALRATAKLEERLLGLAGNIDRDAAKIVRISMELAERAKNYAQRVAVGYGAGHIAIYTSNPFYESLARELATTVTALDVRRNTFFGLFQDITGQKFDDAYKAWQSSRLLELAGEYSRAGLSTISVLVCENSQGDGIGVIRKLEKLLELHKSEGVDLSRDGTKITVGARQYSLDELDHLVA